MANLTKAKRKEMLAFLNELKQQHNDDTSIKAFHKIENHLTEKKSGLVFEEYMVQIGLSKVNSLPLSEQWMLGKKIVQQQKGLWGHNLEEVA